VLDHINKEKTELLNLLGVKQIIKMFDLLPNTLFWIKDTKSRIVHANSVFLDHMGVKSIEHIIGKTDEGFSPHYLARQYMQDDKKVMNGELITDRLELNMLKNGGYGWFSTSKRPLLDAKGGIIGSYGLTQYLEKTAHLLSSIDDIKKPVEYIRENYPNDITIEQLAGISFLSVSALERRFSKHLAKTPKQFINQIRLENARRLIMESNQPIADISEMCGFKEHSYFSKQFKAFFAIQPSQLRIQAKKNSFS
jgi:AraC-like DNA-binding protein